MMRPTHSSSWLERQIERRPQCVGHTSAAMRRPHVGRNALAARRPQSGRLCTDLKCLREGTRISNYVCFITIYNFCLMSVFYIKLFLFFPLF